MDYPLYTHRTNDFMGCAYPTSHGLDRRLKMILEQETYAVFGYYPSELAPQSHKRILAKCDDCGKVREIKKKNYHALCQSCSHNGERNSNFGRTGEKHPMFGKRGEKNKRWKRVKRICETCGKEIFVIPSHIKNGRGKFCSRKCHDEWQSKHNKGENNPSWKGGVSFEPYCEKFDEPFREYIREKFGRVCFLCPKTEVENGRKLSVHHVNYNKNCGCDGDLTCQFVPLCMSCHSRVNFNREEWTEKIMNMLRITLKGWYI